MSRIHLPPLEICLSDSDCASSVEEDPNETVHKKPQVGKSRKVRMAPTLDPSQSPFNGSQKTPIGCRKPRRTRTCPAQAFVVEEKPQKASQLSRGSKSCRHRQDIEMSPQLSPQDSGLSRSCKTSPLHRSHGIPDFRSHPSMTHGSCRRVNSNGGLTAKQNISRSHCPLREPLQLGQASSGVMRLETWTTTPSTTTSTPAPSGPRSNSRDFMITKVVKWRCGSKIGQGSYGSVYKALELNSGVIFAVKKAFLNSCDQDDRRYIEKLDDELKILQDLRHPNIVSYLGHECLETELCIFMEFVPGGSIASMLKEFGPLNGPLLRSTTLGALRGLDYLHTRSPPVCHRDVKGANVLVDLTLNMKLADFGCSKRSDLTTSFTTIGSIPWMAPEVIQQQDGHGRKADIWSLGCTVIEMATAELPWGKGVFDNPINALRRIGLSEETPGVPESMPADLQVLVHACLSRKVEERPWASELLKDSCFFLGKVSIDD